MKVDYFKYLYRLILMLIVSGSTACSEVSDGPDANLQDTILSPSEYRFVISRDGEGQYAFPATRVSYQSYAGSHFETGDHIGIFTDVEGQRQIQNDVVMARSFNQPGYVQVLVAPKEGDILPGLVGTEIPVGLKNEEERMSISYIFTYPIHKDWTYQDFSVGVSLSVRADQSTKEAYEVSDFLWNCYTPVYEDGEEDYTSKIHSINMHHFMSCIIVLVPETDLDVSNGKGVTLRHFRLQTDRVVLSSESEPGNLTYSALEGSETNVRMYCQSQDGDNLLFRAVVPAGYTIPSGSAVATCSLIQSDGQTKDISFSLPSDLTLKDNHCYVLTIPSGNTRSSNPYIPIDRQWERVVEMPLVALD